MKALCSLRRFLLLVVLSGLGFLSTSCKSKIDTHSTRNQQEKNSPTEANEVIENSGEQPPQEVVLPEDLGPNTTDLTSHSIQTLPSLALNTQVNIPLQFKVQIASKANYEPFTVKEAKFSESSFSFVGGSYPGTSGTCSQLIRESCSLHIEFRPKKFGNWFSNLKIQAAKGIINIPLTGHGIYQLGAESDGRHSGTLNGYNTPAGAAWSENFSYVADYKNRRVQIYNHALDGSRPVPVGSLGQPTIMASSENSDANNIALATPRSPIIVGDRLLIVDTDKNRILIWNSLPTKSGVQPDVVLGQLNFEDSFGNETAVNAASLDRPLGIASDGTRLAVADSENNRVLIWNTIPTVNGTPVNVVIGQENFSDNLANRGATPTAKSLFYPMDVVFTEGHLAISDSKNHRVILFDTVPTSNDADGTRFLGQSDGLSNGEDAGGLSDSSLDRPYGLAASGSKLFVSDFDNHRVLVFNSWPSINKQTANFVLGQEDFTSQDRNRGGAINLGTMYSPTYIDTDSTRLIVTDAENNRLLIWNTIPSSNVAADGVQGQPTGLTGNAEQPLSGLDGKYVSYPIHMSLSGEQLAVNSYNHGRTMIWNTKPHSFTQAADIVLGKPDFISGHYFPTTSQNLSRPRGVHIEENFIAVAENGPSRVLIWTGAIASVNEEADVVLGQFLFTTTALNQGGISASSLSYPYGVRKAGNQFFVADTGNQRVLIWNSIPTVNKQPADIVLGQLGFGTKDRNFEGVTARSMNEPKDVLIAEGKMLVADANNHRILIWNTIPTTSSEPADLVIGQPDLETVEFQRDNPAKDIENPVQLAYHKGKLYMVDNILSRVFIWSKIPTVNDMAADWVVGAKDFEPFKVARSLNSGQLFGASGIAVDDEGIFVCELFNSRVLKFPHPEYK